MKKTLSFLFLFYVGFIFSQQKDVILKKYTFEEAYVLQEKKPLPIVVFFHTDWCKFCFTMKKNTFSNKEVIKLLNDNFYFISFDAESKKTIHLKGNQFKNISGTHQLTEALATKNETISYPSTVIISPKNTIDEQINSFVSAKELKKLLSRYLKKQHKKNRH